jgi:hypothetical protein
MKYSKKKQAYLDLLNKLSKEEKEEVFSEYFQAMKEFADKIPLKTEADYIAYCKKIKLATK